LREKPSNFLLNPIEDPPDENAKDHLRYLRSTNSRIGCNSILEYEILFRMNLVLKELGGFTVHFLSMP